MRNLKPLKTEKDYENALVELERLWGAETGTPAGDRLEVLATLIDVFEAEHCPMDPPDPIEAIKFRLEQEGLSRQDLVRVLGSRSRVSEILNRQRRLTLSMIRRLSDELHIPASALIPDYRLRKVHGSRKPRKRRSGKVRPLPLRGKR